MNFQPRYQLKQPKVGESFADSGPWLDTMMYNSHPPPLIKFFWLKKCVLLYYTKDLTVINNTQYLMQCNPELTDIQLISLHATIFFFI